MRSKKFLKSGSEEALEENRVRTSPHMISCMRHSRPDSRYFGHSALPDMTAKKTAILKPGEVADFLVANSFKEDHGND
jgi:hypothetical protein